MKTDNLRIVDWNDQFNRTTAKTSLQLYLNCKALSKRVGTDMEYQGKCFFLRCKAGFDGLWRFNNEAIIQN